MQRILGSSQCGWRPAISSFWQLDYTPPEEILTLMGEYDPKYV